MEADKQTYIHELDREVIALEHRLAEVHTQIRELQNIARNLQKKIDFGTARVANLYGGAPIPSVRLPLMAMADYIETTSDDFQEAF